MKGSGSTINIKAIIFLWAVLFVVLILILSCGRQHQDLTKGGSQPRQALVQWENAPLSFFGMGSLSRSAGRPV